MSVSAFQPMMRREYASITNATYTMPDQVATYVKSATHKRLGLDALKSRSTRSAGRSARSPGTGRAPRLAAHDTFQTRLAHQALDRAARHHDPVAPELPPDLARAVEPARGHVDAPPGPPRNPGRFNWLIVDDWRASRLPAGAILGRTQRRRRRSTHPLNGSTAMKTLMGRPRGRRLDRNHQRTHATISARTQTTSIRCGYSTRSCSTEDVVALNSQGDLQRVAPGSGQDPPHTSMASS